MIVFVSLATYVLGAVLAMRVLRRLRPLSAPFLVAAGIVNLVLAALIFAEAIWMRRSVHFAFGSRELLAALLLVALSVTLARAFARTGSHGALPPVIPGVFALLAAAFVEELLFRGIILGELQRDGAVTAVLGSTVLFTLVHVPTSKVTTHAVVAWFGGGLALAAMAIFGAPIAVLTAAHFTRNVLNAVWIEPVPARRKQGYYALLSASWVAASALIYC